MVRYFNAFACVYSLSETEERSMQNIEQQVTEKRRYPRFTINSALTFTIPSESRPHQGFCKNLSHSGILFTSGQALSSGDAISINLQTSNSSFAPLKARVEDLAITVLSRSKNAASVIRLRS